MAAAYKLVTTAFNRAWSEAAQKTQRMNAVVSAAFSGGEVSSGVSRGGPVGGADDPDLVDTSKTGADHANLARAVEFVSGKASEILERDLADVLARFQQRFLSPGPELAAAQAWLNKVLRPGAGTGVNANVEAGIWNRASARVAQGADLALCDGLLVTMGAGVPVAVQKLRAQHTVLRQQEGLARQRTEAAVQANQIEVENTKFAVEQVIKAQKLALDAARDYIGALIGFKMFGMQLGETLITNKFALIDAAMAAASARIALEEQKVRVLIAEAEADTTVQANRNDSLMTIAQAQVQMLLSEAQSLATQASAMLNSFQASAGTQAGRSEGVSYNYQGDVDADVSPRVL